MKHKILILTTLLLPLIYLTSPNISKANPLGILHTTEINYTIADSLLYGKYPCIGANDWYAYYLDTTSAYAHTDGNVATLSCVVLDIDKNDNYTSPKKVTSSTYIFKTYKQKKKRIINLEKLTYSGNIVASSNIDANKDKYLYALFWRVAGITGMNHFLD